jgi:aldose 1-epimerase
VDQLELAAGDYALTVAPGIGGSIRSFSWRGEALMRPAAGPSVLDAACFPLVPYPNRIANGRFDWDGQTVALSPNFPGHDHPHPLHGFGWISAWQIVRADKCSAGLEHRYPGGEWPWAYVARQTLRLSEKGLQLGLSIRNLSDRAIPAGLGFHPYFPRTDATLLRALHRGEWQNDPDCLPVRLCEGRKARDWWQGRPVATRSVDTVYTGRAGDIAIVWPERQLSIAMQCDPLLSFTSILVPSGEAWFCAEPVSHMTNAANAKHADDRLSSLSPGQTMRATVMVAAATAF